jgi:hypothetical protein
MDVILVRQCFISVMSMTCILHMQWYAGPPQATSADDGDGGSKRGGGGAPERWEAAPVALGGARARGSMSKKITMTRPKKKRDATRGLPRRSALLRLKENPYYQECAFMLCRDQI